MWYSNYVYAAGRGIDDQILLVAANSVVSVLGAGLSAEQPDTIVPIELVQGDKTIRLSPREITSLPFLHAD